jgi:RNA polymerase sigma factor (sigma-70 family)
MEIPDRVTKRPMRPPSGPASPPEGRVLTAAQADDRDAREHVVHAFAPHVAQLARQYRRAGIDTCDLRQAGMVGLLTALERFDARRGTPFWAYASWYVRRAMQAQVADLGGPVVLSDRAHRQLARVKEARGAHQQQRRGDPPSTTIEQVTGLAGNRIAALGAAGTSARSLDAPWCAGEAGEGPALVEVLRDASAEESLERAGWMVHVAALRRGWRSLSPREQTVLRSHFGLGGTAPRTLKQIGAELGVSAERARQLEERALDALRAAA